MLSLRKDEIEGFIEAESAADEFVRSFLHDRERDVFRLGDGSEIPLTWVGIDLLAVKLLYYLTRKSGAVRTIETGFGFGVSTVTMLLAKRDRADQFHVAIDPTQLDHSTPAAVLNHIEQTYGSSFERIWQLSEIALPKLLADKIAPFDLAFIDGNHHFDGTLLDFYYLDRLCRVGALIVFDDIRYPAIESVLNFIEANKPNYRTTRLRRLAVLEKTDNDKRQWDDFKPFRVPNRVDWTPPRRSLIRRLRWWRNSRLNPTAMARRAT